MKKNILILSIFLSGLLILSGSNYSHQKSSPVQSETKTTNDSLYFLLLSDVHLNTFSTRTKYGEDTGLELWQALLIKLKSILTSNDPPKFIVYLGDLPAHYNCMGGCYLPENHRKEHNQNLERILTDLRELVSNSKIPLLYVPGNNDPLGGDYYSFEDSNRHTPLSIISENDNPYPALNVALKGNNPPFIISNTHPDMGYFSAEVIPGLRVIAMNSVILGNKYNPLDGISHIEAGNTEMQWLDAQLKDAEKAGDHVYIAMHIPPGIDAYAFAGGKSVYSMWAHLPGPENRWQNRFLQLTTKYQKTISGILFGHTHMDEVRRLYDSTGQNVTAVGISCPGVSAQHFNNPGFKMVYFDAGSKSMTDFVTRYTTPSAQTWGNDFYRFSEVFHEQKGETILKCLSAKTTDIINKEMEPVYMVKHWTSPYNTQSGIDVKFGQ